MARRGFRAPNEDSEHNSSSKSQINPCIDWQIPAAACPKIAFVFYCEQFLYEVQNFLRGIRYRWILNSMSRHLRPIDIANRLLGTVRLRQARKPGDGAPDGKVLRGIERFRNGLQPRSDGLQRLQPNYSNVLKGFGPIVRIAKASLFYQNRPLPGPKAPSVPRARKQVSQQCLVAWFVLSALASIDLTWSVIHMTAETGAREPPGELPSPSALRAVHRHAPTAS